MSQPDRNPVTAQDALDELDPEDRGWLEERLVEYAVLLEYLHDH